jgi:APA family basic amino acid/polyamine antiporter
MVSAVNYVGVRVASGVQTVLTGAKLLAIVLIVAGGLAMAGRAGPSAAAASPISPTGANAFLLAMVAGLFAYGGWHMVTYTAGETLMPARTIPTALVAGTAVVTVSYIALNLVYLAVLPLDAVRSSTRIAADAADGLVGRGGSALLAIIVMVSSLGALTGIVMSGPRVYYSMAHDGLAFRWLGYVDPRFRTPTHAIGAQAVWASVLAATGAYRELFTRVIYTEWLFFALMAAGLFVLRRRRDYSPAYRAWGYPVVPLVFIAASVAIVVTQLLSDPVDAVLGLGMVAIGAPIYYLWRAHR